MAVRRQQSYFKEDTNLQAMDFQFLLSARYQFSRWSSCIDTGTASWWRRRMWGASLSASPGWTSAAGGPGGGGHAAAAGAPAGGRGGAAQGCAGDSAAGARGAGGEAGGRQAGGHPDQRGATARQFKYFHILHKIFSPVNAWHRSWSSLQADYWLSLGLERVFSGVMKFESLVFSINRFQNILSCYGHGMKLK